MQNNSAAVTRLNVPPYQWSSEALHGVINEGVTEYPEPIGLAATFDAPGIHTIEVLPVVRAVFALFLKWKSLPLFLGCQWYRLAVEVCLIGRLRFLAGVRADGVVELQAATDGISSL